MQLYVIKAFILINDFYLGKIKNRNNVAQLKYEQLLYLNCAYMYANSDKDVDYVKDLAKKKLLLSEALSRGNAKYNKFKNKMIEIYKRCGLKTNKLETIERNYFFYQELLQ